MSIVRFYWGGSGRRRFFCLLQRGSPAAHGAGPPGQQEAAAAQGVLPAPGRGRAAAEKTLEGAALLAPGGRPGRWGRPARGYAASPRRFAAQGPAAGGRSAAHGLQRGDGNVRHGHAGSRHGQAGQVIIQRLAPGEKRLALTQEDFRTRRVQQQAHGYQPVFRA